MKSAQSEEKISKEIDAELKATAKSRKATKGPVLLLLGPGDSGKTTLLKQMKIIHGTGFTDEDRRANLLQIQLNIMYNIKALIQGAQSLDIPLQEPHQNIQQILQYQETFISPDMAAMIHRLWSDTGIQQVFARGNEFQIHDTAKYFLDSVEKFAQPDYTCSNDDILHTRLTTTRVSTTVFNIRGDNYTIVDVGGQTKYRQAWSRFFDDTSALLFVISLASYDQLMEEEESKSKNRMVDSLELFDSICNHSIFITKPVILLMNKSDLLEQKIKSISASSKKLGIILAELDDTDYDRVRRFFRTKFQAVNKTADRRIYTHFTTNIDTGLMRKILDTVIDIVINSGLKTAGLI